MTSPQQIPSQRFLVVMLEPGLHSSRITGLFHNITLLPGVLSVTDMSTLSQETIDAMVMLPDENINAEIEAKARMLERGPRVVQGSLVLP